MVEVYYILFTTWGTTTCFGAWHRPSSCCTWNA